MLKFLFSVLMASAVSVTADASRPSAIYAIGDFNDWQLPAGEEELNGGLPMTLAEGSDDYYWEDLKIPAGTQEMMFFYTDADSGEQLFLGSPLPPFTLYKFAGSVTSECTSGAVREDVSPIRLRDWRGSRIMGGVYLESRRFSMASFDGPTFPNPAPDWKMYALVSADDGDPVAIELDGEEYDPYFWTISFGTDDPRLADTITGASAVRLLFSPDPSGAAEAGRWGRGEMECEDTESRDSVVTEFTDGGEAFSFILPADGEGAGFHVTASFSTGLAWVSDPGSSSGIPATPAVAAGMPCIYYDMQGRRVANPIPGEIYLRLKGGKIEKTIEMGR